ncbi:MAG: hypothetical protein WD824_11070 [Cyclobacteriaceae bacterium]
MKQLGRKLGFFTAFIIPGLVITGFYFGGYWNFTALVFSFLLVPLIDQYLGEDTSNISGDEAATRSEAFITAS